MNNVWYKVLGPRELAKGEAQAAVKPLPASMGAKRSLGWVTRQKLRRIKFGFAFMQVIILLPNQLSPYRLGFLGKINMGVPKQRKTRARSNNRRSHHAISGVTLSDCEKCGKKKLPHILCENCGTYKQREIVDVLAKLDKKERKRREKEQEAHEKEQGDGQESAPAGGGSLEELSKK